MKLRQFGAKSSAHDNQFAKVLIKIAPIIKLQNVLQIKPAEITHEVCSQAIKKHQFASFNNYLLSNVGIGT